MIMIAGPNGSGKSTLWGILEPVLGEQAEMWEYLNADSMLREHLGISIALKDLPPDELTRLQRQYQGVATTLRAGLIEGGPGTGFVFETVFSDEEGHKLSEIARAKDQGFLTVLVGVAVDDIATLIARVQAREEAGEHGVAVEKQRARYPRVLANFEKAIPLVDIAVLVDNSGEGANGRGKHRFVACFQNGQLVACVENQPKWAHKLTLGRCSGLAN